MNEQRANNEAENSSGNPHMNSSNTGANIKAAAT